MEKTTAYHPMTYSMRTGKGFANQRRFSRYFYDRRTDYFGARDMVNKGGDRQEVADAAEAFESVLFTARFNPTLWA
jgi:hypothetical protein